MGHGPNSKSVGMRVEPVAIIAQCSRSPCFSLTPFSRGHGPNETDCQKQLTQTSISCPKSPRHERQWEEQGIFVVLRWNYPLQVEVLLRYFCIGEAFKFLESPPYNADCQEVGNM